MSDLIQVQPTPVGNSRPRRKLAEPFNLPLILSLSKESGTRWRWYARGSTSSPRADHLDHGENDKAVEKLRRCFLGVAVIVGLAAAVGLASGGCSQGSYPVDIFYEMHYQQWHKSQEPPRLSPPESSVPWFAGPTSTSFNTGQHLFTVNCSMCHGLTGKGDGPVLQTLKIKYGYQVKADPDLSGNLVASFPDGVIETFIVNGIDVMPNFSKLLSAEERRSIIQYIRTLQQR